MTAMTRDDIAAVLELVPDLTDHGVGLGDDARKLTPEQREAALAEGREKLLRSADACTRACEWLGTKEKTATVGHRAWSSYGLKHLAEPEIGYVTNGAFIAAAIHCGFPYRITPGSLNVGIGISRRSLKGLKL